MIECGASLYTRKRLSHWGRGRSLVPPYTRGNVSHGGQGESLVPPYTLAAAPAEVSMSSRIVFVG